VAQPHGLLYFELDDRGSLVKKTTPVQQPPQAVIPSPPKALPVPIVSALAPVDPDPFDPVFNWMGVPMSDAFSMEAFPDKSQDFLGFDLGPTDFGL
jgi:hypothetical protein